jgi:hypothetical protein
MPILENSQGAKETYPCRHPYLENFLNDEGEPILRKYYKRLRGMNPY